MENLQMKALKATCHLYFLMCSLLANASKGHSIPLLVISTSVSFRFLTLFVGSHIQRGISQQLSFRTCQVRCAKYRLVFLCITTVHITFISKKGHPYLTHMYRTSVKKTFKAGAYYLPKGIWENKLNVIETCEHLANLFLLNPPGPGRSKSN